MSYKNGMQIVDISSAQGRHGRGVRLQRTQGDVQIFRQADEPGRVFATSTSDTFGSVDDSGCYREAAALGFDVRKQTTSRAALPGAAGVTSLRRSVA